jgi:4-amino-4-deoxy-L-arabinose transferase-like glycosyltransferase
VWTASLLIILGVFVLVNGTVIERYPPISRDEIWVLSASFKLAETGTLGSDMFRGFHGADEHFFIALPVYELFQALAIRLFNPSIMAARSVSLASGMVVITGVGWLGLRWFGALVGVLAMLLVTYWQTGLLGYASGLPLTTVSTTGRYDVTALALSLLAVVFLELTIASRRMSLALICGIACGLATLTQFFGVIVLALALAALVASTWRAWRQPPLVVALATGFWISVVPYLYWIARHRDDFKGQAALKEERMDFFNQSFYLSNLGDELRRYRGLWQEDATAERAAATLFMLIVPAALALIAWRGWRERRRGDLLLMAWCSSSLLGIALLDATNAGLYAVVFWPPAVLASAALLAYVLQRGMHVARRSGTIIAMLAVAASMAIALTPGIQTQASVRQDAARTTPYVEIGHTLDEAVPRDETMIGSERWWWALRERDYLALTNLWRQWIDANAKVDRVTFSEIMERNRASVLLADNVIWGDLGNYDPRFAEEVRFWIDHCAERVWSVADAIYGEFQLFQRREDGCL